MTMTYPVSAVHSEKITVPSATAFTGVPTLATMSMAKWLFSELNVCDTVPVIGAKIPLLPCFGVLHPIMENDLCFLLFA